jgi:hypothetical protein
MNKNGVKNLDLEAITAGDALRIPTFNSGGTI